MSASRGRRRVEKPSNQAVRDGRVIGHTRASTSHEGRKARQALPTDIILDTVDTVGNITDVISLRNIGNAVPADIDVVRHTVEAADLETGGPCDHGPVLLAVSNGYAAT